MTSQHLTDTPGDLAPILEQLQDLAHFVEQGPLGDIEPPREFGKYRVIDEIGRGGQALVYLAYDPTAQRSVIIKWHVDADVEQQDRVLDEARALSALDHPNVVRCLDVDRHANHAYLVLQPLTGQPLHQAALIESTSRHEAIQWVIQLSDAIQALHDCGWIHGDISPRNILISREQRPILIDFGLARRHGDSTSGWQSTAPDFRPPEWDHGLSTAGPAADVYALAKVLDWIISPRLESRGPNRGLAAALDSDLRCLVARATSPRPHDRFVSARAFQEALRKVEARHEQSQRRQRWQRRLSIAVAASLLLGITTAGWQHLSLGQPTPPSAAPHHELLTPAWISSRLGPQALSNDFQISIRCRPDRHDSDGRLEFYAGESLSLQLVAEKECVAAVYSLAFSESDPQELTGTLVAVGTAGTVNLKPRAPVELPLECFESRGETEWLYLVAQAGNWDPNDHQNFPGAVRFKRIDSQPPTWIRGVSAKQRRSEFLVPYVVRPAVLPQSPAVTPQRDLAQGPPPMSLGQRLVLSQVNP